MDFNGLNTSMTSDMVEFEALDSSVSCNAIEFDLMVTGDKDIVVPNHNQPPPEADAILEPYAGMEFESEEAAKAFYNSYARRTGFSTRVSHSRRSKRDGSIIQRDFVCAREGFRIERSPDAPPRLKRPRPETRVGCKAMLGIKVQESGRWVVSAFVKQHNHDLVPPDQVHCLRSHRHISGAAKSLIDTLQGAGVSHRGIMKALIKEYGGISNVGFTEKDCLNYLSSSRPRTLGGSTQLLLDYLKNKKSQDPTFFYAVLGDEDEGTSNIFWADSMAKTNFTFFGDAVTFDTTYRSNKYRLPLATFTGVNNHGQPILFGCALLINESEASFLWLFETWLAAMSGRLPVSITTDHDRTIRLAVNQVFPDTHHRFCKWHILKECQEKLSSVLPEHLSFESELHRCVNLTESVEEFESCWSSLMDKYGLGEHELLQSLYANRNHWVPVYLRDTFFAEMSVTQSSDSINSYFDGYVNAATSLQQFVKVYEKALDTRYQREIKADYDTMNTAPVLKTPSPMEKQAAEIYTRKLFVKFQEELVETLAFSATKVEEEKKKKEGEEEYEEEEEEEEEQATSTYRVTKFGDDQKTYFVKFNVRELKASCSCQMFEFSGLLCRHVLTVFRVINILTLPSHYILKRWTKKAKSSFVLEDRASDISNASRGSLTVRYNNLLHEALKYVDEGIETFEVYHVAMAALQEAANKVDLAKNGVRLAIMNGPDEEDEIQASHTSNYRQNCSKPLSADEQDKKIEELTEELEHARWKREAYRENLLSVLKNIEDRKLQWSVKLQNIRLGLKE